MAVTNVTEVVIGATRKKLLITVTDENLAPIPITGGAVALQGTSADIPGNTLDVAGTILDGPNGVAQWTQLGGTGFITTGELGSLTQATYVCRVKFTDTVGGGLVDYGPEFSITWKKPPV